MRRLLQRLRRPASFLLLPLSAIPLIAVVPIVSAAHETFEREHSSGPIDPPAVVLSAEQLGWAPVPAYRDAVPVLVYPGVSDVGGHGEVRRNAFASQMALLDRMGFSAISLQTYVRWRKGEGELPSRPILVTFDGAKLDTYRGADEILDEYGQRATIFISGGAIDGGEDTSLLTWRELKDMADSERWDIASQGHDEHDTVVTGPDGALGPFYSSLRYTESTGHETIADFERRVTTDVFAAREDLEHHGLAPLAMALPGGDRGPDAIADPALRELVSGVLGRQFPVTFVAADGVPGYTERSGPAERYAVTASTTLAALHAWLRAHSPAALAIRERAAAERAAEGDTGAATHERSGDDEAQ